MHTPALPCVERRQMREESSGVMCKEEMDKEESSGIERRKEMDMGGKLKEVTCNLIVEI